MDPASDNCNIERKRDIQEDNFKPVFKRYKNRTANVNLTEVVDFGLSDVCSQFEVTKKKVKTNIGDDVCSSLGLKPLQEWQSFSLNSSPGFIFIRNPFKLGHQRYWLKRLLQDIPNSTNKTNLSDGFPVSGESVWDLHCQSYPTGKKSTFSQLRWVTLGYHYNWTAKLYDPTDVSPFPEDIGLLSSFVAASLGFQNFKAEAAIVNYYNMNSTLGGHNDHSEQDHDAPLISFSFGQSAIFLVGGLTKAATPTPMLLRSGDIIILSSSSRLAFHGVPRILHDDAENLKRCWGVDKESERKDDKILTPFEIREEEDNKITGVSREPKKKEELNDETSCKIEGRDDIMLMERREEPEICKVDVSLPSTTSANLNLERNLQSDFGRRWNETLIDADKAQQVIKCRKASSVSDSSAARRTESNGQLQAMNEKYQPVGNHYGTDAQKTETEVLKDYSLPRELVANSSLKQNSTDSGVTDGFPSFRKKFPNIDEILQKISIEADRLLQNALWEPFEKHLQNARLNVSVRQVNSSVKGT